MWETITMDMREVFAVGDRVAFAFHFDATGRDGVRAGRDQASFGTIRNGLLYRIQNYATWDGGAGGARGRPPKHVSYGYPKSPETTP